MRRLPCPRVVEIVGDPAVVPTNQRFELVALAIYRLLHKFDVRDVAVVLVGKGSLHIGRRVHFCTSCTIGQAGDRDCDCSNGRINFLLRMLSQTGPEIRISSLGSA